MTKAGDPGFKLMLKSQLLVIQLSPQAYYGYQDTGARDCSMEVYVHDIADNCQHAALDNRHPPNLRCLRFIPGPP